MARQKEAYPVSVLCRLMGVSRTGFYDYLDRRNRPPDPLREEQRRLVRKIAESSGMSYGTRRMAAAMTALCHPMGRFQARSLMAEASIQVRYRKRYRVTTKSDHDHAVHPNRLNREFTVAAPNQAWVSDVTYVWTHEGWLYLAVIIDLYSRKVVGWSMSARQTARMITDALLMAIWARRPSGGLIFHSDRGVQYASRPVRQLLRSWQIVGSMSRKGDCWDNAVAESFFGTLKSERLRWNDYRTREEARQEILEYITMFYNPHRLHSTLNYRSPMQFERDQTLLAHVA